MASPYLHTWYMYDRPCRDNYSVHHGLPFPMQVHNYDPFKYAGSAPTVHTWGSEKDKQVFFLFVPCFCLGPMSYFMARPTTPQTAATAGPLTLTLIGQALEAWVTGLANWSATHSLAVYYGEFGCTNTQAPDPPPNPPSVLNLSQPRCRRTP